MDPQRLLPVQSSPCSMDRAQRLLPIGDELAIIRAAIAARFNRVRDRWIVRSDCCPCETSSRFDGSARSDCCRWQTSSRSMDLRAAIAAGGRRAGDQSRVAIASRFERPAVRSTGFLDSSIEIRAATKAAVE
jgi:hypothetical protein